MYIVLISLKSKLKNVLQHLYNNFLVFISILGGHHILYNLIIL